MSDSPITIERLFFLGDYKNLKVNVVPSELDDATKIQMMVGNVIDAYAQLFVHQIVTAELHDGDVDLWKNKLLKLYEIKSKLQED